MMSALGKLIFTDKNLSLKKNQACVSCHDPAWGFTAPSSDINNAGAVMGGSVHGRFGNRKPPSAAYASQAPVLYYDDEDETYVGGNFWDGRATGSRLGSPVAEQSQAPFINPAEQALPDKACVVYRVAHGTYGDKYAGAWGRSIFDVKFPSNINGLCEKEGSTVKVSNNDQAAIDLAYDRIAKSIAAFEGSSDVNQFSSKYDLWRQRKVHLTPQEERGFKLYNGKANCAACHPSDGDHALFTDYTYDNIGVPANPKNPARLADPTYRDLGVGGFQGQPEHYGREKVPTLRNLDKRGFATGVKSYMHNGVFKSLEQVVHFYNTRDVLPACKDVVHPQFGVNCWPEPEVLDNVNRDELGHQGMTAAEEADLVAFLKTLSDGYSVGK